MAIVAFAVIVGYSHQRQSFRFCSEERRKEKKNNNKEIADYDQSISDAPAIKRERKMAARPSSEVKKENRKIEKQHWEYQECCWLEHAHGPLVICS